MSDQPEPRTIGKRKSCDCDDPSVPHYPEDHLITPLNPTGEPIGWEAQSKPWGDPPKPTGEWTENTLYEACVSITQEEATRIADAHNASLVAVRERLEAKWKASMVDVTTALQTYEKQLAAEREKAQNWLDAWK